MVKQKDVIDIQRKKTKTKTKKLVFIRSEEKKREIRSDFEEEAVKRSETYRQIGFSRCECVCLSRLVVVVVVVATLSVCLWNLWCGGSVVQLFLNAQHNLNRPTSSIQAIELSMKGGRKEIFLYIIHTPQSLVFGGLWSSSSSNRVRLSPATMRRLLIIRGISATFLATTTAAAASFYWKNLFLFLLLLLRSCEMKERLYRMMMQTGDRAGKV